MILTPSGPWSHSIFFFPFFFFGKTSPSNGCAWNSWIHQSFCLVASFTSEMWLLIGDGSLAVNANNLFIGKLWFSWTNGKRNQKGQKSHSSFLLSFEEDKRAERLGRAEGLGRASSCISLIIPEHTDRGFLYPCGTTQRMEVRKDEFSLSSSVLKLIAKIDACF